MDTWTIKPLQKKLSWKETCYPESNLKPILKTWPGCLAAISLGDYLLSACNCQGFNCRFI